MTAAVDYLVRLLDRLPHAALSDPAGAEAAPAEEAVRRPPPAGGRDLAELLAVLDRAACLPDASAGLVTTGASMATLSAVVTARSVTLPETFLAGTLYLTRADAPAGRESCAAGRQPFCVVATAGTTNTGDSP
jgi:hypothetical protein